jgi:hypothetical protein
MFKNLPCNNSVKRDSLLLIFFFVYCFTNAQTIISTDDFENTLTVFSQTSGTGVFYSGNSNSTDKPGSSPFAVSNIYGYGISNGTVAITSSNINTFGYTSLQLTLRVAAFSIASASNGMDNTDAVQIEISPDGGTTYYNTVKVIGNSNGYWSYSGSTGNANTSYDGNSTPVTFQPAGGGSRTGDGYSTITVTSLPAILNLKVKITLTNNSLNERWIIDNFQLTGNITTPLILSPTATNISVTTADLGGTITDQGSSSVIERGTLYKTTSGVTITDNPLAEGGTSTGTFSHTRSGFSAQTQYYYKAYAKNSNGTALSPESSFYTLSNPPLSEATNLTATPVDIDEIDLAWTAATFPFSGASANGYIILSRSDYTNPSISDITNGTPPSALPLTTGTTLVATITSGSSVSYNNTGLLTNTQYNYMLIPFTWDGSHSGTYNYYTTNALTGNALTLGATGPSADFRTKANATGNWNTYGSSGIWQSYNTSLNKWQTATVAPTSSANSIEIRSGCTVIIDAASSANALIIDNGGTLNHPSNYSFNIVDGNGYDGSGVDFIVNGTYILNGQKPTFLGSASAEINSTGVVRADANIGGGSDDFGRLPNVLFTTGSIFQWNVNASAFEAGGSTSGAITYFPNSSSIDKPIFRISANPGDIGGTNSVTFNGKVEVTTGNATNIRFVNSGTKYFRDGLGSPSGYSGKITNTTNCGAFVITGSTAVINGSLTLNIDDATSVTNDLEIASGASVTISGSPTIKIGSNAPGSNMVINGTLLHNGTVPIEIFSGNLYINGYLDPTSTGSFKASSSTPSSNSNVLVSGTGNTSAGALKLSSGANYINTFTMNRGSSATGGSLLMASSMNVKSFVLTRGVLATDNNLVTWLNLGPGSSLSLPSGYNDSYVCTCNSLGTEITATGSNGFRINNVSGNTDQMFPVGTDFTSSNRMAINMNGSTPDNFTVVVGKGDIGYTQKPRVNRIWYVSEGTSGGSTASMKLYFTKRNWSTSSFGTGQDEIESGFLWNDGRLVQKDASGKFVNVAQVSTTDVPDFTSSLYDTEIYGLFSKGISLDYFGTYNGISNFVKFSVINLGDIVLAEKIVKFKAYKKENNVQIDWSLQNEINIDHYTIEHSQNDIDFTILKNVNAVNNGSIYNYSFTDKFPARGDNFYRIRITDKNGAISYTSIIKVNIDNAKTSVTIYPNPVHNKLLNVQFSNLPLGKYQLMIYGVGDELVFSRTIDNAGGFTTQSFILPAFVLPGAYVIKVFNKINSFSSLVIVD